MTPAKIAKESYQQREEARLLLDEARLAGVVVTLIDGRIRTDFTKRNRYLRERLLDEREAVIDELEFESAPC